MGGSHSRHAQQAGEAQTHSQEIDAKLKRDKRKAADSLKLLLLGAGESGKSTIFKQMKILHNSGFTDRERRDLVPIITKHATDNFVDLVNGADKLGLLTRQQKEEADELLNIVETEGLDQAVVSRIVELWESQPYRTAYSRREEFQLADSTELFLNSLVKISQPHYLPSNEHVLACRVRSTGVAEISFVINDTQFRMVDVGGQKSERRKWINCFDNVNALIFVAAISEYNQTMFEDESTNRVQDALILFDDIVNKTKCFANTTVILFLNKRDLFEDKVQRVDLNVCFPKYEGGLDVDAATEFIEQKFKSVSKSPTRQVYTHMTCATNTDNMKFVFDAVKDAMIVSGAFAAGML